MSKKENFMANLMAAKQIMDKSDADNPIVTAGGKKIQESAPTQGRDVNWGEDTNRFLNEEEMRNSGGVAPTANLHTKPTPPQNNQIANSNLPANIKNLMMENPIPLAQMPNSSFSLDEAQAYMPQEEVRPQQQNPQQQINEIVRGNVSGNVGLNEEALRGVIDEQISKYFARYFTKTMLESVKKKVLSRKKV